MTKMSGFFELRSWLDLHDKLEWEFKQLSATPDDTYIAYNFFVTAWHLLEWVHPDPIGTSNRSCLKDKEPLLQICEHLAVGAKHFEPTNKDLKSVASTGMQPGALGGAWGGSWGSSWGRHLTVVLQGEAQQKYGDSIAVEHLASLVMNYWREFRKAHDERAEAEKK